MSSENRRRRRIPLGVRVCAYLAFGFVLSPVVLSVLLGDSWSSELRQAVVPTLALGGLAELFHWLERRRA
jgi:TctA family transporter